MIVSFQFLAKNRLALRQAPDFRIDPASYNSNQKHFFPEYSMTLLAETSRKSKFSETATSLWIRTWRKSEKSTVKKN
jgi:hypothetical protein